MKYICGSHDIVSECHSLSLYRTDTTAKTSFTSPPPSPSLFFPNFTYVCKINWCLRNVLPPLLSSGRFVSITHSLSAMNVERTHFLWLLCVFCAAEETGGFFDPRRIGFLPIFEKIRLFARAEQDLGLHRLEKGGPLRWLEHKKTPASTKEEKISLVSPRLRRYTISLMASKMKKWALLSSAKQISLLVEAGDDRLSCWSKTS